MDLSSYVNHFRATPSDLRTAVAAEQAVLGFEEALRTCGITIRLGSKLEAICLNLMKFADLQRQAALLRFEEMDPEDTAERLGLEFFLQKVIRLHQRPGFEVFLPHLALLNQETCTPSLSIPHAGGDANNKVFELLFGLSVFENADEFVLDDPVHSSRAGKAKHPDIKAHLDGTRWAFECKSLTGFSALTAFERLWDAVDQIEASDAEIGVPVFHLRRAIGLNEFWPKDDPENIVHQLFGPPIPTPDYVAERTHWLVCQKIKQLVDENGRDNVAKLFEGKKVLPCILILIQGIAAVQGPRALVPMRLTQLICAPLYDGIAADYAPLFERLNRSLHGI